MRPKQNGPVLRQQSQALTYSESTQRQALQSLTTISANDRWIDLTLFEIGEHRISCPYCSKQASDKTLGITVRAIGDAVAHCFRCEYTQSLRSRMRRPLFKPQLTLQEKRTTLSSYARSLWSECKPISGTALDYLRSRNCVIPPADGDLRWHPNLKHPSGYRGPALVGLVTHVETGEAMSLHRTWITSSGKAKAEPNRMLLGGHTSKHGVIRLYHDEYVTTGLGVAEGIETALSLAHEYRPVWAAISAGNMGSLPAISGVECLTIAVDSDDAGRKAAESLSHRWYEAGVQVRHAYVEYGDLNDHLELLHG
jgi:putative DNA primase/helicase